MDMYYNDQREIDDLTYEKLYTLFDLSTNDYITQITTYNYHHKLISLRPKEASYMYTRPVKNIAYNFFFHLKKFKLNPVCLHLKFLLDLKHLLLYCIIKQLISY